VRQLFYQFVARELIANLVESYRRLGRTLVNARCAGLIDWSHIEDRTRQLETFPSWSSPADILRAAAQSYREDLWLSQPYRPEIWIEKSALIGVIEPVCRRWRVPYTAVRGYDSHSELYATGKRFQAHLEDRLKPIGLHLGDHDPSGWHMTQNLREEISTYARAPVEVRRLGLNLDQITDLGLPANPTKETDKRYAAYVREHRVGNLTRYRQPSLTAWSSERSMILWIWIHGTRRLPKKRHSGNGCTGSRDGGLNETTTTRRRYEQDNDRYISPGLHLVAPAE